MDFEGPEYTLVINGHEVRLAPETITLKGVDYELTPSKMIEILFDLIRGEYIRRVEALEESFEEN